MLLQESENLFHAVGEFHDNRHEFPEQHVGDALPRPPQSGHGPAERIGGIGIPLREREVAHIPRQVFDGLAALLKQHDRAFVESHFFEDSPAAGIAHAFDALGEIWQDVGEAAELAPCVGRPDAEQVEHFEVAAPAGHGGLPHPLVE